MTINDSCCANVKFFPRSHDALAWLAGSHIRQTPEISSPPISLPLKSNMASVPFVGTLESDDDVDQLDNESDSDEEPQKVYHHYSFTYSPFMPSSDRFLARLQNTGPSFTSYWITIVPIVLYFVLQKVLTHVNQVVQSGPVFCSCSVLLRRTGWAFSRSMESRRCY